MADQTINLNCTGVITSPSGKSLSEDAIGNLLFDGKQLAWLNDLQNLATSVQTIATAVQAQTIAIADAVGRIAALEEELNDHITGDAQRWQQLGDIYSQVYAIAIKAAQEVYAGTTPQMDISNPTVIMGSNGLVDLLNGTAYTVLQNGFITVTYQAILGVAPVLQINGETVDYAALSILGIGSPSAPIQVSTGDVITATGVLGLGSSFNVTFYPNL